MTKLFVKWEKNTENLKPDKVNVKTKKWKSENSFKLEKTHYLGRIIKKFKIKL